MDMQSMHLQYNNSFRIQACDSVMCGYFCIGFIDFVLNGESLTDFIDLFFAKTIFKKMIIQF